ncbi:archaeosine synthase subunit alpha [Methanogenium organophilum]|uniref:Archaeosine synthase subunit alpha n=1 Tax=Methanogenium organophilum TaxID=2199 RepID=A0A9X9S3W4_METOG|nr:archaeosine synthase subunit alpha [Methanogenium organophilum]WAI01012.1 archaeosine synthase subunit alpha [Methanogenium organophilum]
MSLFERTVRDGMGRTGKYTSGDTVVATPGIIDPKEMFPDLFTHPFANTPPEFPEKVRWPKPIQYTGILNALVGEKPDGSEDSAVIFPGCHTLFDNPRRFTELLIALKEKYSMDTAWYAPASALPSNAAILIYCGFDLFDYRAVDLMTVRGMFCTPDGEFSYDKVREAGLCTCEGCRQNDLGLHNRIALETEIATARWFIRSHVFREFIEKRTRNAAWQVAVMRHLDATPAFSEPVVPIVRSTPFSANTADSLKRVEVHRFVDRVIERFIPTRTDTLVLLPCSARKPYSLSQSHRKFSYAIQNRAHELILTSPMGIVPRELEAIYPAGHYDIPVTGYWDREEREFIASSLARYLEKHQFGRIIAHLDEKTRLIAEDAAARAGVEIESTCANGRPTSPESLRYLEESLAGVRKIWPDAIRGTLSWQFDTDVNTSGLILKGRRGRRKVMKGRNQMFSIDESTGLLRPTMEGWGLVGGRYHIVIDDFIPQGDVLAPGILDADPAIREGDEVFVTGPRAEATGKAVMGAKEMMHSSRGVAVKLRKVKKG